MPNRHNVSAMLFQKLHAWQAEHGITDSALADKIMVHQTAISRAKRGLRVLGIEHQLAIQKITKTVSPADWAEFYAQTTHLRPKKARGLKKNGSALIVEVAA